ncbi:uncharacterized protein LOC127011789 [Drosophila biarmipes]|uniref:uncharacterized protein LOC127011789 n=1 Tax=Drosophila biarmipes TaxID=125945 RepID=UPI0021CD0C42|nr:uncharacterized protein LOC127011789 [Drosophila biarmipes]XP_050745863.1 uncharacterized protein LOC127011789 [Drosophila biarmipes]
MLKGFSFEIENCKGNVNVVADALSRAYEDFQIVPLSVEVLPLLNSIDRPSSGLRTSLDSSKEWMIGNCSNRLTAYEMFYSKLDFIVPMFAGVMYKLDNQMICISRLHVPCEDN